MSSRKNGIYKHAIHSKFTVYVFVNSMAAAFSLQGKSRSATAVISYVITVRGMTFPDALRLVQASRRMADPNPAFKERLKVFQTSVVLQSLRTELGISI